ncbi:MAG: hypothetical protein ACI825_000778 [Planctomycetota bacterium]|jgi:hypothetical protein|uniref:DUF4442 domain-containing protein n=1 Tax=Patiriisocius sp. Uisw_047 TaxID=3230969 RepID=UPI0039E89426
MLSRPKGFNAFLMMKLPSAYFCGVRLKSVNNETCVTTVKYKWINQNPFNSMFWAVQGMAAELSTGALTLGYIREAGVSVSMLVANNKASFTKKAKGRVKFTCNDGLAMKKAIDQTIATGEGQVCWMHADGIDEDGDVVSSFAFEWTVKRKKSK